MRFFIFTFFLAITYVQPVIAQEEPSPETIKNWIEAQRRVGSERVMLLNFGLKEFPSHLWVERDVAYLSLEGNVIASIPDSIDSFKRLNRLLLKNNNIDSIPPSLLKIPNLSMLSLAWNRIQFIPLFLREMSSLEGLDLSSNPIGNQGTQYLPPNLTELTINNIGLSIFPDRITELQSLEKLSLAENQVQELPASIGQLTALTTLNLTKNKIKQLPESIVNLINLDQLSVAYNELKQLPTRIGQLSNLSGLSLDYNQLEDLPESFVNLNRIYHLNLANNQFMEVPKEIRALQRLNKLNLSGNPLDSIPDWVFTELPNLNRLILSESLASSLSKPSGSRVQVMYVGDSLSPRMRNSRPLSSGINPNAPLPSPVATDPPPPPPAAIRRNEPPPPTAVQITPVEIDTTAVYDRVDHKPSFDNNYCYDISSKREQEKCLFNTFIRFVKLHLEYPLDAIRLRKTGKVTVS